MYDDVASVRADNVLTSLLVVCSDIEVCGMIAELASLFISVDECTSIDVSVVTLVVSDTLDAIVDGPFALSTVLVD